MKQLTNSDIYKKIIELDVKVDCMVDNGRKYDKYFLYMAKVLLFLQLLILFLELWQTSH